MTTQEIEHLGKSLLDDINNIDTEYIRGVCELVADLSAQGEEGHVMNSLKFAKKCGATEETLNKIYHI